MNRLILGLFLLLISPCSQSWASQGAIATYFSKSGIPLNKANPGTCASYCAPATCSTDITNNNYQCLLNCSHNLSVPKFVLCSNQQFAAYVQANVNAVKTLSAINDANQVKINQLQIQLATAQKKAVTLTIQNAQLTKKITHLKERLAALIIANQNLNAQLIQANAIIQTQAQDLHALQQEILANENEIASLNQELIETNDLLEQLLIHASELVEKINEVEKVFETKTTALRELNGTMIERIKEAHKILNLYENELMPYAAKKEQELNRLMVELQETLDVGKEFMDTAREYMNHSKEQLDHLSKAVW